MANPNVPGFAVYRHRSGRAITTREVLVLHTGVAIHKGSFVKQSANTDEWTICAAGDAIDSLALGFRYRDSNNREVQSDWLPASITHTAYTEARPADGIYMKIVDDAFNVDFVGQLNAALTAPVTAETLNFDIVQTNSETAAASGQEIAASTAATTSAQLRGVRYFKPFPEDAALADDLTLTHARLVVRINESESDPAQTTTAVGAAS